MESGIRILAEGLKFPEGPVAMADGSVVLVEIERQTVIRVLPDGTVQGTIFHPAAFSWTQYEMVAGHYTKVAFTTEDIADRAAATFQRPGPAYFESPAWLKPIAISITSLTEFMNSAANKPASTNAVMDVALRPNRSTENIINKLAQG